MRLDLKLGIVDCTRGDPSREEKINKGEQQKPDYRHSNVAAEMRTRLSSSPSSTSSPSSSPSSSLSTLTSPLHSRQCSVLILNKWVEWGDIGITCEDEMKRQPTLFRGRVVWCKCPKRDEWIIRRSKLALTPRLFISRLRVRETKTEWGPHIISYHISLFLRLYMFIKILMTNSRSGFEPKISSFSKPCSNVAIYLYGKACCFCWLYFCSLTAVSIYSYLRDISHWLHLNSASQAY